MKVIYFSKTKNIAKFVNKCDINAQKADENLVVSEPFLLICYTTGFGEIPKEISAFFEHTENQKNLTYVVGSGNKNWGAMYCKAAHDISESHNVPLLMTFELSGNTHDVKKFLNILEELE